MRYTFSKLRTYRYLAFAGRILLGLIFLYAGAQKAQSPVAFREVVYNYRILPDLLVNLTAVILPWIEIILGILLILGVWLLGAFFLSNVVLLVFLGVTVFNWARGLDIHCGCFSTAEFATSGAPMLWYVVRDGALFLLSLFLFFRTWWQEGHRNCIEDVSLQAKM